MKGILLLCVRTRSSAMEHGAQRHGREPAQNRPPRRARTLFSVSIFVLGLGDLSKIVLIFLECLYPIAVQTLYAMRSADSALVWAALSFGAGRWELFWNVLVPSVAPLIFAVLRIALPGVDRQDHHRDHRRQPGSGLRRKFQSASFQYARAMAAVVVIGFISFALNRALVRLRARLIFWQHDVPTIGWQRLDRVTRM